MTTSYSTILARTTNGHAEAGGAWGGVKGT
jgi:hypothetical protein